MTDDDFANWEGFRRQHEALIGSGPAEMLRTLADRLRPLLGDFRELLRAGHVHQAPGRPRRGQGSSAPFGRGHSVINAILNRIALYSAQATLNPNKTCEFPTGMPTVGGRCLIFDGYPSYRDDEPAEFRLLALVEVFPLEMAYARTHGGAELLKLLKANGHYPYCGMNREPVG